MSAPQAWPRPNWGNRPSPVPPEGIDPDTLPAAVPDAADPEKGVDAPVQHRRRRNASTKNAS